MYYCKVPSFSVEGKDDVIIGLWAKTRVIAFGERTWLSKSEILLGRIAVLSEDVLPEDVDLLVNGIIGRLVKGCSRAYAAVATSHVDSLRKMGFDFAKEFPPVVEEKCLWNFKRGLVTVAMEKVA